MEQKANSFPFAFVGNAVGERGTLCPEDFYEYKGFSGSFHPISLSKEVTRSIIIILSVSGRPGSDFDIYILTAKVEENLKNGWILKENLKTSPGGFFEKIAKQDWTFAKKRVS